MNYEHLSFLDRLLPTKIYYPSMNKQLLKRLNWEQIEARPQKEVRNVVKGTSKRIVVVKSPDPKVFEQAIFIVREDFLGKHVKADALKEAQRVADEYVRGAVSAPKRILNDVPLLAWITAGVAAVGIIALTVFLLIR